MSTDRFVRVASLKAKHHAQSVASHHVVLELTGELFRAIRPERLGSLTDIPVIDESMKLLTLT